MKAMRFIVPALLLVLSTTAYSLDQDMEALMARLAAQDARMNDLRAKIAGGGTGGDATADNVVSLRKNGKVSIGGLVVTKYTFTAAKSDDLTGGGGDARWRTGDFTVSDAYLDVQVDVNEHFDAFFSFDMHNGGSSDYYNAEVAYVRWKNLCETGFGLKVGRDALVFGDGGVGELGSYAAGAGDGIGETDIGIPVHNAWDISGVTQITPYWEGMDGRLSLELSFMQNVYEDAVYASSLGEGAFYVRGNKVRSRNYGIGTMSVRARISPVEDLNFTLSVANYRSNGVPNAGNNHDDDWRYGKNNTVYGLAANYRPSFFNRLSLWAQWVRGQDVYFFNGMKSDAINFGLSFDLAEGLTWFAQGDCLRWKHQAGKATAWAFYTGLQYSLPRGISTEIGWKHERVDYRTNGAKSTEDRANTVYGLVGFEF